MPNSRTAAAPQVQKLAVVVHFFYEDQWPEFVAALAHINCSFTLFISLRPESRFGDQIRQRFPNAVIKAFPNIGRDVAPFLAWLPELQAFDLVCKIHSKRSEGRHAVWRKVVMHNLLGSPEIVDAYLTAFAQDADIAYGGGRFNYVDGAGHISVSNQALHLQHGPLPVGWGFFAGTMFWCRPQVFAGLDRLYPQDCFAAHGDTDGHPEHVVERAFGLMVMQAQKKIMLYDVDIAVDFASNLRGNPNWGDTYNAFSENLDDDLNANLSGASLPHIRPDHGYISHGWAKALGHYDRILQGLRDAPVRLLEFGIEHAGAGDVWAKYFPNGTHFVGCHPDEKFAQHRFADPRVTKIMADAASPYAKTKIMQICSQFDIIIDHGTPTPRDMIAAFLNFFPTLTEGGVYIAQVWDRADVTRDADPAATKVAFFQKLCELINDGTWAAQNRAPSRFAAFADSYDLEIDLTVLPAVLSIEFSNGCVTLRKGTEKILAPQSLRDMIPSVTEGALAHRGAVGGQPTALIREREISVTVVIPFHNGSAYLADAIRSVHLQTRPVQEVVIVDAGSDPIEAQWLSAFAKDAAFNILTQDSTSQAAAYNLGIHAATGSHVCLLDQTDIFHNHHNEALVDAWMSAQSDRLAWVFGDYRTVDENFVDIAQNAFVHRHDPLPKTVQDMVARDLGIATSATILDRQAVLDLGGFDARLRGHKADDLFLRLFLNGYRGQFLAHEMTSCRVLDDCTDAQNDDLDSIETFFSKWYAHEFMDLYPQPLIREALKSRIIKSIERRAQLDGGQNFAAHFQHLRRIKATE